MASLSSQYDPGLQVFQTLATAYRSPYAGIAFGYANYATYKVDLSSLLTSGVSPFSGGGSGGFGSASSSFSGTITKLSEEIKSLREEIEKLREDNANNRESGDSSSKKTSILGPQDLTDKRFDRNSSQTQYTLRNVTVVAAEKLARQPLTDVFAPENKATDILTFEVTRSTKEGNETLEARVLDYLSETNKSDFYANAFPSAVVMFKDGENTATFQISAIDDNIKESKEIVAYGLFRPLSSSVLARDIATIDNDVRPDAATVMAKALEVDTPDTFSILNNDATEVDEGGAFRVGSVFNGYLDDTSIVTYTVMADPGIAFMVTNALSTMDDGMGNTIVTALADVNAPTIDQLPLISIERNQNTAVRGNITVMVTSVVQRDGAMEVANITDSGDLVVKVNDPDNIFQVVDPMMSYDDAQSSTQQREITVTIHRDGDSSVGGSVDYTLVPANMSANPIDDTDFFVDDGTGADDPGQLPMGTVTFAAGDSEVELMLTLSGDNQAEPDEEFQIVLSNPMVDMNAFGAFLEANVSMNPDPVLVITDPTPATPSTNYQIVNNTPTYTDSDPNMTTTIQVLVMRTGDITRAGSVDYTVAPDPMGGSTVDDTDFFVDDGTGMDAAGLLPMGTVMFAAGVDQVSVTLTLTGEAGENVENFLVDLSNPQVTGSTVTHTVSPSPTLMIAPVSNMSNFQVVNPVSNFDDAPDMASRDISITIQRTGNINQEASVNFEVLRNPTSTSPVDDDDFFVDDGTGMDTPGVLPMGSVMFAAGQAQVDIMLRLTGEAGEMREDFLVNLSNPQVTGSMATHTVSPSPTLIIDPSASFMITLTSPQTVPEDSPNPVSFLITGTPGDNITLDLTIDATAPDRNNQIQRLTQNSGGLMWIGTADPAQRIATVTLDAMGEASISIQPNNLNGAGIPDNDFGFEIGVQAGVGTQRLRIPGFTITNV